MSMVIFLVCFFLLSLILFLMLLCLHRKIKEYSASKEGYISFGGDDMYQSRNIRLNIHDAILIARVTLKMDDETFLDCTERVKSPFIKWCKDLENSIMPCHKPEVFDEYYEVWDEYQDYKLKQDLPVLAKIIFCKKEKVVLLIGNHIYLGGYFLAHFVQHLFCDKIYSDVFPKNKYIPLVSEGMMLFFITGMISRKKHIKLPLFNDDSKVGRFHLKLPKNILSVHPNKKKPHLLYRVIAYHIHLVMRHLKKDRLRVTLPVSFSNRNSFNTVGAIFLDIDYDPDPVSFTDKIRRLIRANGYQVSASNNFQRIFPTRKLSTNARNLVDLTLTVVPQKTLPNNLIGSELDQFQFTMLNIRYPVYIMAFIFEDSVHSSFMINTAEFDIESFKKERGFVNSSLPEIFKFNEKNRFIEQ